MSVFDTEKPDTRSRCQFFDTEKPDTRIAQGRDRTGRVQRPWHVSQSARLAVKTVVNERFVHVRVACVRLHTCSPVCTHRRPNLRAAIDDSPRSYALVASSKTGVHLVSAHSRPRGSDTLPPRPPNLCQMCVLDQCASIPHEFTQISLVLTSHFYYTISWTDRTVNTQKYCEIKKVARPKTSLLENF